MKISQNRSKYILSSKPVRTEKKDLFEQLDTVQLNSHTGGAPKQSKLKKLRDMAESYKAGAVREVKDSEKEGLVSSPLFMSFIGCPGAGKGTQGRPLAEKYNIPHISAGKLLREIAHRDTPLAQEVKPYIEKGELVPDNLINDIIEERLSRPDCDRGFILDGFPRTGESAKALDEILARQGRKMGNIIELKVSRKECLKRLLARGRHDDKPDIINHRYDIFLEEHDKIEENFKKDYGLYKSIEGERPIDSLQTELTSMIDEQILKENLKTLTETKN